MEFKKSFFLLVQIISPFPMSRRLFRSPIQLPTGVLAARVSPLSRLFSTVLPPPQNSIKNAQCFVSFPDINPLMAIYHIQMILTPSREQTHCGLALLLPVSPASFPAPSDLTLYLHSRNSKKLLSLGMRFIL